MLILRIQQFPDMHLSDLGAWCIHGLRLAGTHSVRIALVSFQEVQLS
jgi:hypothetical protein